MEPLQQQVSHEIATKEEAARQLEDMRRLHADAERRVAVLQGTLFAQGSATPMQRRDPSSASAASAGRGGGHCCSPMPNQTQTGLRSITPSGSYMIVPAVKRRGGEVDEPVATMPAVSSRNPGLVASLAAHDSRMTVPMSPLSAQLSSADTSTPKLAAPAQADAAVA